MKQINKDIIKIKNLIGILEYPTIEDLLYEIVSFLVNENRFDGVFNIKEVSLKTRVRIDTDFFKDIEALETKGYIKKLNYTKFEVIKHLWELTNE